MYSFAGVQNSLVSGQVPVDITLRFGTLDIQTEKSLMSLSFLTMNTQYSIYYLITKLHIDIRFSFQNLMWDLQQTQAKGPRPSIIKLNFEPM